MAEADPAWPTRLRRMVLGALRALAARLGRNPAADLRADPGAIRGQFFRDHPQAKLGPVTLYWGRYAPCVRQQLPLGRPLSARPPRRH